MQGIVYCEVVHQGCDYVYIVWNERGSVMKCSVCDLSAAADRSYLYCEYVLPFSCSQGHEVLYCVDCIVKQVEMAGVGTFVVDCLHEEPALDRSGATRCDKKVYFVNDPSVNKLKFQCTLLYRLLGPTNEVIFMLSQLGHHYYCDRIDLGESIRVYGDICRMITKQLLGKTDFDFMTKALATFSQRLAEVRCVEELAG